MLTMRIMLKSICWLMNMCTTLPYLILEQICDRKFFLYAAADYMLFMQIRKEKINRNPIMDFTSLLLQHYYLFLASVGQDYEAVKYL